MATVTPSHMVVIRKITNVGRYRFVVVALFALGRSGPMGEKHLFICGYMRITFGAVYHLFANTYCS